MTDLERERRLYRTAAELLWQEYGISDRAVTMVVYAMATCRKGYAKALQDWADYERPRWSPERWNTEIAYRILKAGHEPGDVAGWMAERAEEVLEFADGVHD